MKPAEEHALIDTKNVQADRDATDSASFTVTADFAIDEVRAGKTLAAWLEEPSAGVGELWPGTPINRLERGTLVVAVRDMQGNVIRFVRTFSVGGVH